MAPRPAGQLHPQARKRIWPQSLKHLLLGPSQKDFVDPCSKWKENVTHRVVVGSGQYTCCKLHLEELDPNPTSLGSGLQADDLR